MSAQYWIAQYIADVFRNEPKNVGVFVRYRGILEGRFFGEIDQQIDGRRLRAFPYPDVYRQWIQYWRKQIGGNTEPSDLVNNSTPNFLVKYGGFVSDVEGSSIQDVMDYLYALVVSEGGFREALGVGVEAAEEASISLVNEVVDALVQERVLETENNPPIRHPVRRSVPVRGRIAIEHRPAFVQQNGRLYVMETVDFTIPQKKNARDHAGWSAYMFQDIRSAHAASEQIAIVRMTDEDERHEEVQNGLALLRNEGQIVNWNLPVERAAFLGDRINLALN